MKAGAVVRKLLGGSTPTAVEAAQQALGEAELDLAAAQAKLEALRVGTAELVRAARAKFDADETDASGAAVVDAERLGELRMRKARGALEAATAQHAAAGVALHAARRDAALVALNGTQPAVAALAAQAVPLLARVLELGAQRDAVVAQGRAAAKLLGELDGTPGDERHIRTLTATSAGEAFAGTIKAELGLGRVHALFALLGGRR
jgi:hypothetical protein